MSDAADPLHLVVRSDRSDLPKVLAWVRAFIAAQRLADRPAMVLELAAEELVLNAMTHGRPRTREGTCEGLITCSIEPIDARGSLRFSIEDEGPPFDPTIHAAPEVDAPLEARKVGGLGVHLVRSMAEVRYARLGNRNRVEVLIAAEARRA